MNDKLTPEQLDDLLNHINPDVLYNDWVRVGMGLYHSGYSFDVWEKWSKGGEKFKDRDCRGRWDGFGDISGNRDVVTIKTLIRMAKQGGWQQPKDFVVTTSKSKRQSIEDFRTYLEALHDDEDLVCIVTEAEYNKEHDKWSPSHGGICKSVSELKKNMETADTLMDVIGPYELGAGCWIRINPMNMFGCSDEEVVKFKYALVECDDLSKDEQRELMLKELRLPLAAIVDSGRKSIHGIVKVFAKDRFEYNERVQYLYRICRNYGLTIDEANRNPSRMSRLAGAVRGTNTQKLIGVNMGSASWDEWLSYIKKRETGLPAMRSLAELISTPPILADPLIDGLLRKGRKMLISGASKTGKSFSLIGLAYAFAFGLKWMGMQCAKTKVLYLNLEIADDSFDTRLVDTAMALGISTEALQANTNLHWLNMRGINKSLESLATSIIDMCKDENFGAIILDPIYKVSFANENDAQEMANFCNAIDTICQSLNTAMIYCHHHSKGMQSGKSAIDRMSGSGVLARDPDAIIDMLELEYTGEAKNRLLINNERRLIEDYLDRFNENWREEVPEEYNLEKMDDLRKIYKLKLPPSIRDHLNDAIEASGTNIENITPIRVSASVREFPPMQPRNVYFMHPLHHPDTDEIFIDARPLDQVMNEKTVERQDRMAKLKHIYLMKEIPIDDDGYCTVADMAVAMQLSQKTIRNYLNDSPHLFEVINGSNRHKLSKFRMKNVKF